MKPHSFNGLCVAILLAVSIACVQNISFSKLNVNSVNGGTNCATCTVIIAVVEQLSLLYNTTIDRALLKFCNYLPAGLFRFTCQVAVDEFGPIIINAIYQKKTPDVVCQALNICRIDAGQPECRLFPKPDDGKTLKQETDELLVNLQMQNIQIKQIKTSICNETIFKEICNFFIRSLAYHQPSEDIDNDGYSLYRSLRGSDWKGKDCDDINSNIRPGNWPKKNDTDVDSNCNGIYGLDATGKPYETLFCLDSKQMGLAVIGDSMSSHFHLPEQWLDVKQMNEEVFYPIGYIIENEIDWPQYSGMTGHEQTHWPLIKGNTSSLYLKLWERNKCNFRDFQNIGVNGASSGDMRNFASILSRNRSEDQPLILVLSVTAGDVCLGFTAPEVMYNNVYQTLQFLDTKLPLGSHVLLTGLLNGTNLYTLMSKQIHPIGRLRNDVTYDDVYSYLSCLRINPCSVWLTSNDTARQMSSDYGAMLSNIIKNVTLTHKFGSFDAAYIDYPFDEIIQRWTHMGHEPWLLIEPVDGLHLNQYAQALLADTIWDYLQANHPDWLGPINPNNDLITKIFGDQGGY